MSYQVLARKWRPKLFEALVGQEHVVRALTNALEQQRLHHAYLFTGTRGVGKTTLARILAKSLNCETGITAHPCGVCSACVDIDRGRFVDMLEVDAASNTQVDSMRELLDNAQYAPTVGRFKVYIIDEVHMLSRSAFNAMLKTLEEPPAHVKFILATTDPQKMPVTVLSRCLQFNLRQMSTPAITSHLQEVLAKENIPSDSIALQLISRAANGSMRDALSLLDQAIAYGGNRVNESEVRAMLGAIDQSYLYGLLDALIAQDGPSLMAQAKSMEERSLSFDTALADLAQLLHQLAVAQTVPESIPLDLPERTALLDLATKLPADKVQLYYQIALLGRRDLGLAPDEFAGFTMCLLRMLAFSNESTSKPAPTAPAPSGSDRPIGQHAGSAASALAAATMARSATPSPAAIASPPTPQAKPVAEATMVTSNEADAAPATLPAAATPAATVAETPTDVPTHSQVSSPEPAYTAASEPTLASSPVEDSLQEEFDGNWRLLVDKLKLGLARALAQHCELIGHTADRLELQVPEAHKHLLDPNYQEKLKAAIEAHFGRKMHLQFSIGGGNNTPAHQISQEKAELQSQAESSIQQDGFVQALMRDFGAQIIPSSIKPLQ
ncbi:DNA polymerase-3 subunit gamma/tau [Methylovorus glucosotrophus]|uniref:DNA polymerase III subunit gamma/tau n=1 Tax=Methylovorus glucosotrophus TaxID=266009 RepID=UPI0013318DC8|nr:DNA polymerase III subunit gamma/tau [Methylovorus glucosotrophus]KAF0843765.1 DNA polymerase-3 subunit gamma/tau [Methylovorus glucosotrophus]